MSRNEEFKVETLKKLPSYFLIVNNKAKLSNTDIIRVKELTNGIVDRVEIINEMDSNEDLDGHPDLILLLNDVLYFHLKNPLLLYKAEIFIYKKNFCMDAVYKALSHYSECKINNGK
ncbi:hypothetical protein SLOPH_1650 [Spraguea lophii 42_110]|uniref:Uncharacterized protein n=1 Tax=Spraguea lophii (strain 42_110) TaxID=1358809 RepID=S7W942_SPRLO|nr:hypothetical protein SLOPH_1650 [Spraguea lophii 42_110]